MRIGILLLATLLPAMAMAEWVVEGEQSSVYYSSLKNNSVAENNRFNELQGTMDAQGALDVRIELDSVDTSIVVRDERMRGLLFEVVEFPQARIQASVDESLRSASGASVAEVPFTLSLHGLEAGYVAKLNIWRVDTNTLIVSSREPVLVNATDFNLQGGLEKLRELAGLQSIAPIVPVGFTLTLRKRGD